MGHYVSEIPWFYFPVPTLAGPSLSFCFYCCSPNQFLFYYQPFILTMGSCSEWVMIESASILRLPHHDLQWRVWAVQGFPLSDWSDALLLPSAFFCSDTNSTIPLGSGCGGLLPLSFILRFVGKNLSWVLLLNLSFVFSFAIFW